jgi:DNA-binding SARP family transcriptional activator
MTRLEISLLGPTRLSLADQPIQAKLADKAVALLAYLALEVQIAQQRDALAGLLWPEQSNAAARRSLRQAVFKLHQVLPTDALLSTRQTLELNPQTGYRVDVVTFIDHLTACRNHSHAERQSCPTCQARLREAVALYRGDFLAQIYLPDCATFEAWALLKREWLRHEVLQALSDLATSAQAKADYETAYKYAWRQLELDPLHEVAHRQLIRSLAGQGRRSEALAQYQKCCDLLAAELGVEPAVETTTLYKQISDGAIVNGTVAATNQQKSAPLPQVAITLTSPSHKLPLAPTPFIGRQTELQILTELIAKQDVRLITIVGAGGMGKTRLALAAGELELSYDRFANGVYFISLAPLSAPDQLVPAVAEALNFNF